MFSQQTCTLLKIVYFAGSWWRRRMKDGSWSTLSRRVAKLMFPVRISNVLELICADAVPELVSQRRRWLNGAFFAAVYAQTHFTQIWRTDHSLGRKIALHIQFFYQFINLLFSFFSLVLNIWCALTKIG